MELKTTLDEELAKRFQTVKKKTGMRSNQSVLAMLISKEYDRIQSCRYRRVSIDGADYELIEKEAMAQGKTVDEYVEELVEERIKNAKEGVKHAKN
jgi:hypothetical protein